MDLPRSQNCVSADFLRKYREFLKFPLIYPAIYGTIYTVIIFAFPCNKG